MSDGRDIQTKAHTNIVVGATADKIKQIILIWSTRIEQFDTASRRSHNLLDTLG